jgi:hypothetical protein
MPYPGDERGRTFVERIAEIVCYQAGSGDLAAVREVSGYLKTLQVDNCLQEGIVVLLSRTYDFFFREGSPTDRTSFFSFIK